MTTIPAELNALAGQLQNYSAPDRTIPPNTDCKLTYELLQWTKTHPDGLTDDRSIGSVEISRFYKEEGKEYQIVEKRNGGDEEVYEACVKISADETLGESIQSWDLNWYQASTPQKSIQLNGTVQNSTIETTGITGQRQIESTAPVSCQWVLPFTLSRRTIPLNASFTTIDELTYCKTDQNLQGPVQIKVNDEPLLSFHHTGQGTLPIHYIFDAHGRPLFVTFTLVSWILRDISYE